MNEDYIWMRLILDGVATYTELSTIVSFPEAVKMGALLDMRADSERYSNYIASKEFKKK